MTHRIYTASRTTHAEMWRGYRHFEKERGYKIVSSWIDQAGQGETSDLSKLWLDIVAEIQSADLFVLYATAEDFPLKGVLIEAGAALAYGVPVRIITDIALDPVSFRPLGSWCKHPLCSFWQSIAAALIDPPK